MIATLTACVLLGISPPPSPALVQPHESVSRARLMGFLRALPEKRAPDGSPAHVEGLVETENWLRITLEDMGYEVHEQKIFTFEPPEELVIEDPAWHNLWIDIPGTSHPEEMLIIGAHFDAVRMGPGADDNGTGTAGALELARVYRGLTPERTIRIVFFNLEETGLVGSLYHANDVVKPAVDAGEIRVIGMVSLEMLGYYSDEEGSQRSPVKAIPGLFEPPTKGDFLALVGLSGDQGFSRPLAAGMQSGLGGLDLLVFDILPAPLPDMMRSDHAPFWAIKVPAVMLTDTSEFRTPYYHKPSDRVETIDADRFTSAVRGVAAGIWALANPGGPGGVGVGED